MFICDSIICNCYTLLFVTGLRLFKLYEFTCEINDIATTDTLVLFTVTVKHGINLYGVGENVILA